MSGRTQDKPIDALRNKGRLQNASHSKALITNIL